LDYLVTALLEVAHQVDADEAPSSGDERSHGRSS
jgi:hypothetical protein